MQKKRLYISLFVIFGILGLSLATPTQIVSGAQGTTGAVETGSSLKANLGFWFKMSNVQDGYEYILVPDVATMGLTNHSFYAGGSTDYQGPFMLTSVGTIRVTLYGAVDGIAANSTGGSDNPTVLSVWQIRVTNIGDSIIGPDLFTNLISFFLPIIIVMTIVLAFRFRDRIKQFGKND
jgi:hypothetical protein